MGLIDSGSEGTEAAEDGEAPPADGAAGTRPETEAGAGAEAVAGSADTSALASELHTVLGLLVRRTRAASGESELTPSQRSVAARLLRDGPTTTADLARAELVRPQSMRMTVSALEERGLIRRTPHPTDGRQVLVELSEAGRDVITGILRAKQDWLTEALDGALDARQRATLAAALPVLRTLAGGEA